MPDVTANNLAEKIARLLQNESAPPDFYSLQKSIEKISERLEKIEMKLSNSSANQFSSIAPFSFKHPSQDKFDVSEIIAEVTGANSDYEKPCPYEPTGKPCDHCSMCNSRGF